MASLWGGSTSQTPPAYSKDDADVADTGLADIGLPSPSAQPSSVPLAGRPQLARNQPQAPPPHQPPPPPAPQQIGNAADSLSLMQLKRIVTDFPRVEPTAYTFTYADTASFEEEIDEWFSYNEAEFVRLRRARDTFTRRWKKQALMPWSSAEEKNRKRFLEQELEDLDSPLLLRRCKALQSVLHIVLGVWNQSAAGVPAVEPGSLKEKPKTTATKSQVEAMKAGVLLITECDGVGRIYTLMKQAFDRFW
jgi:hypothetical protein